MNLTGCQGRERTPTISEKECPECGNMIEIFSNETEAVCEKCGAKVYNSVFDCVQWCKYAKMCVGPKEYESIMEAIAKQQERQAAGE